MRFDMHIHTSRHSPDSVLDPLAMMQRAREVGLDGLAEPDDAREGILPGPHHGEQIVSYLLLDAAVDVAARAQFAESPCVVIVALLLHHSTVCRDRACSHLPRLRCRSPGHRISGTLFGWQHHLARLAPTT